MQEAALRSVSFRFTSVALVRGPRRYRLRPQGPAQRPARNRARLPYDALACFRPEARSLPW